MKSWARGVGGVCFPGAPHLRAPETGLRRVQQLGAVSARLAFPPPPGCAERAAAVCLRVNRACFPFTPSGSVFVKHFLLLALWEYSFLACTAALVDSWVGKRTRGLIRASAELPNSTPPLARREAESQGPQVGEGVVPPPAGAPAGFLLPAQGPWWPSLSSHSFSAPSNLS